MSFGLGIIGSSRGKRWPLLVSIISSRSRVTAGV
jgi:hypothetical protein